MNKKALTETDIRTKFITPALLGSNGDKWNVMTQIREEAYFTRGRVIVRGKTVRRGEARKADYILSYKPNLPLAVIEAKDNHHSVGDGMQQALDYAEILDVPFAYSSNGDAFLEHDRTVTTGRVTREIPLDQFPTPEELWARFCAAKGYTAEQENVATQDYYDTGSQKSPRYYQLIAINRTVDAIARGLNRILLVMATGTGKTYTAFQIIWRLWKSGAKKRILFLVDRNILADQTKTNDFKPFGTAMTKITNRAVDKSFEIYLSLYQAVTGTEEEANIYKLFSLDFFDLVIVDECHRGSAAEDAAWREVLHYFSSATQIGLTATPKETRDVSNIEYFGDPIYTYSLRQGISDGFLAPYKVVRVGLDRDLDGWRPEEGQTDKYGRRIEDREYNDRDFDRNLILEKRTAVVAARVTEFLRATDRFAKTIIFCENIDHAERMRQALVNANPDLAAANAKYVMRVTNPPFGGMEEDGIESNYPAEFRTRETADLFLVLLMKILRPGGRAGLVLPDGTLFGEGVKTRIKEALLTECNLHTIVRLPNGVFNPYTGIRTNLLFFTKGAPTTHVWYYEHPYPPGAKSYNKGKPIRIEEFEGERAWWGKEKDGFKSRVENEQAWRVSIDTIKAGSFNLDLKNPHNPDTGPGDVDHLLPEYEKLLAQIAETRGQLKAQLMEALKG